MADNELKIKITAEADQLKDGLAQASSAVSQAVSSMLESVTSLNGVMKALSGVIASALSGAAIKGVIDSAESYNASILSLSRVMGTTTEQASVLSTAIHIIGGTTEEYTSMMMKLGMHIKDGGAELERWGITVKDANGNFLSQQEIFDNTIARMDQMKAGTDANELALTAFGRGAKDVYKYVDNLKDAMATAAEVTAKLGPVTAEEAAQTKAASHEMNVATGEFSRMGQIIGADMLPSIAQFTTMLADLASNALPYLMAGINAVLITLEGLAATAGIVQRAVVGSFTSMGIIIGSVAAAAVQAAHGDFKGAGDTIKAGWADAGKEMAATDASILKDMEKTAERISFLWSGTMKKVTPKTPGTATAPPPKEKEGKEDKSRMPEWQEQYKEAYLADEQAHGGYLERKLSDELTYWQKIQMLPDLTSTEELEVARKTADIKIAMYKEEYDAAQKAAAEIKKIEELKQDAVKQSATAAIAAKKEQFATEVALGHISKETEMATLKEFLDEEYAMELAAAQKKLDLMDQGTAEHQKQLNVMAALQSKYALDVEKVQDKSAITTQQEWKRAIQPITSAFDTSVMGIIQGTQTLQAGLAKLFQSITLSFINDTVKTMLSNWLLGENQKYSISVLYAGMMKALGIEQSGEELAQLEASDMLQRIQNAELATSNAAVAATSAASQAGIAAPAVAAFTFSALAPFIAMASAAGGFDVPIGLSPMTQLHPEEMVLPKNIASGLRDMITGGGRGGRAGGNTYHINALDTRSFMSREGRTVLKGLKGHLRNSGVRL